jgi:CRP-like cAMP-binding protein
MTDHLEKFLASMDVFSAEEIKAIAESVEVTRFAKGTVILHQGQVVKQCYFVLSGVVREYMLTDGAENTTGFFTENQTVISYTSYLSSAPSQYYYSCAEDCILLVATREGEKELQKKFPRLEFLTRTILQNDYQQVQQQLAVMINSSAEERYRHLIATRGDLLLRVPHHYLASYIGVTAESFSRIRKRISSKK